METGNMQDEQHVSSKSPFDHGKFFPGSGHMVTLEALRAGVTGSISLITCIGEEGHGKSMLCRILEYQFAEPFIVVSFPSSAESFEYVLQVIALKLNLEFSRDVNVLECAKLLKEISSTLQEQGKRLLILFDEAEKLYLATLERVRKMIDQVNENGVFLQIILFGRAGLQPHLDQLVMCTLKDARELHLTLPPLTEEGVIEYLDFCIQQYSDIEKKDIFSREMAARILVLSQGNFRKINSLARDFLRSSSQNPDDTSSPVSLADIHDVDGLTGADPSGHRLFCLIREKKKVIGAGALIMTLLLFVFFNRETKKSAPVSPATSTEKRVAAQSEEQPITEKAVADKKELPGQPALSAIVTVPNTLSDSPKIVVVAESVQVAPDPAVPPSVQSDSAAPAKTEAKAVAPASVTAPVAESAIKTITGETTPIVKKKSTAIPMLGAEKLPKKNAIIASISPEPVVKNKKLLHSTQEQKAKAPQQLPRKSAAVGESWLAGEKNEHYTLQLMVLADDQAENKLKEILHNEETRQMSENFIVLSKSTSPAILILYYGEYATLAEAREARNNLPPSLRQYAPYPVSVKQAVQKSIE